MTSISILWRNAGVLPGSRMPGISTSGALERARRIVDPPAGRAPCATGGMNEQES
jgi:hypothetical protein